MLMVNHSMSALFNHFQHTEDFPDFINTDVLEEHCNFSVFKYAKMTCQDTYADVLKKSMPLHLFIIPGMSLLEHLVVNVAKMVHQDGLNVKENQLRLAHKTLVSLEKQLGFAIAECDNGSKGQMVLIFEKLFVDGIPTHGAVGALQRKCDVAIEEGKTYLDLKDLHEDKKRKRAPSLYRDEVISNDASSYVEGLNVPLSTIKNIEDDIIYYVFIIISTIICESGGQVIFSRSSEDSMKFVGEAMREMERQSLLTY